MGRQKKQIVSKPVRYRYGTDLFILERPENTPFSIHSDRVTYLGTNRGFVFYRILGLTDTIPTNVILYMPQSDFFAHKFKAFPVKKLEALNGRVLEEANAEQNRKLNGEALDAMRQADMQIAKLGYIKRDEVTVLFADILESINNSVEEEVNEALKKSLVPKRKVTRRKIK